MQYRPFSFARYFIHLGRCAAVSGSGGDQRSVVGKVAGITASVLSFLIFNFFFIRPYYTFQVAHPQDFLAMIVLLSVAILISSLMARIQSNLIEVRARERKRCSCTNLSVDLAGKNDQANIAKTLAAAVGRVFSAPR